MLTDPMQIADKFPVRKSRKQKHSFRESVHAYAKELEYPYMEQKGSFGAVNIVMGDPEKAEYLVTAHYDTCAGMIFPNLITPCNFFPYILYQLFVVVWMMLIPAIPAALLGYFLIPRDMAFFVWYVLFWLQLLMMFFGPANKHNRNDNTSGVVTVLEMMRSFPEMYRDKVCFILFDLEEAGLIGSAAYRKAYKEPTERQLVMNLDCVGDGDHLLMIPTSKLKKDKDRMAKLSAICSDLGDKDLSLRDKGFSVYPSDQKNFPLGVGICALRKGLLGLYMSRIHTRRDTVLEETNVNILRAALTSLITCAENKKG